LPLVLGEILDFVDFSWADDKNNRRALRLHNLSQIIALSTAKEELMALASCSCRIVWARQLAIKLGFPYFETTDVFEALS